MRINRVNLPDFERGKTYVGLRGTTLLAILQAIRQGTPIAGHGLDSKDLQNGVLLKVVEDGDSPSSSASSISPSASASVSFSPSAPSFSAIDESPSGGDVDPPSGGFQSPSSLSGSPGSPSSKQAIMRVVGDDGPEYRGWFCSEEPEWTFRMELEARLVGWSRFGTRCEAAIAVPDIFWQCVEAGSIRATGALPVGAPAMATARVDPVIKGARVIAEVARLPFLAPRPSTVVVSIKGTVKGAPAAWPLHTRDEYSRNRAFWGQAHATGGEVI